MKLVTPIRHLLHYSKTKWPLKQIVNIMLFVVITVWQHCEKRVCMCDFVVHYLNGFTLYRVHSSVSNKQ